MSLLLTPQAKGEEAVSILAQFEDRPGSDRGRRSEHCDGLRREAAGRTALVCVWEAVSHQHAGARCAHELLNCDLHVHLMYWMANGNRRLVALFYCYMCACETGIFVSALIYIYALSVCFTQGMILKTDYWLLLL